MERSFIIGMRSDDLPGDLLSKTRGVTYYTWRINR